jgi:hypothetical protein
MTRRMGIDSDALVTPPARGPRFIGEIYDLARAREALTAPVLNAFCRAFVGADRILGLEDLLDLNDAHCDQTSVRFERNQFAAILPLYGTMVETCDALDELQCLKVGERLSAESARDAWNQLTQIADRWTEGLHRKIRNKMAFHFDRSQTGDGLEALCEEPRMVELFQKDDVQAGTGGAFQTVIGMEVLLRGMNISDADFYEFLRNASTDHPRLSQLVEEVFADLLKSAGVALMIRHDPIVVVAWPPPG